MINIPNKTAVVTPTKKAWSELLKFLLDIGLEWESGEKNEIIDNWEEYKAESCIHIGYEHNQRITYDNINCITCKKEGIVHNSLKEFFAKYRPKKASKKYANK